MTVANKNILLGLLFINVAISTNSCNINNKNNKCQNPEDLIRTKIGNISIEHPRCVKIIGDKNFNIDEILIYFKYENNIILTACVGNNCPGFIKLKDGDMVEIRNNLKFVSTYDSDRNGKKEKCVYVEALPQENVGWPSVVAYCYTMEDPDLISIADKIVKSTTYILKEK